MKSRDADVTENQHIDTSAMRSGRSLFTRRRAIAQLRSVHRTPRINRACLLESARHDSSKLESEAPCHRQDLRPCPAGRRGEFPLTDERLLQWERDSRRVGFP